MAQVLYRAPSEVGILQGPPLYGPLDSFERPQGNIRCSVYSPCGRFIAWALPECVTIVQASTGKIATKLRIENAFELGFSPLGTFIITWQRPSKDGTGQAQKNLKVWRSEPIISDAEQTEENVIGCFVQKSSTNWNFQYTRDEIYCARVVTNEIQFFESGNLSRVWNRLRAEGVTDFALSTGEKHAIAIFCPERKGLPAAVRLYQVPQFETILSQKTFFKGDKAQLKWNKDGTSLLVLAQTEVDRSGKSYYGETTLYLLNVSGGFNSRVDLDKDGPIHDVAWSPNSREFGVIYGYMPAKTVLFNARAAATHTFPLGPRNTIHFAPRGHYVLIAGFGNLAGQMDIYNLEKGYAKVSTIEASNASLCEWCPDGVHILTATTSPRLRVDNGIKIWHSRGTLMFMQDMQELYHAGWRPQPNGDTLLAPSPEFEPQPHASALSYLNSVKTPQKPTGAYRPPGARGQTTPIAFRREDEGGAAYVSDGALANGLGMSTFGRPRRREVPGAEAANGDNQAANRGEKDDEVLSKAAAKNRKKREARKLKENTNKSQGLVDAEARLGTEITELAQTADIPGSRHETTGLDEASAARHTANKPTQQADALHSQTGKPVPHGSPSAGLDEQTTSASNEKRIRALLKKLRAIDDLKMRRAAGERLEGTQVRKMDTEDLVKKELKDMGYPND